MKSHVLYRFYDDGDDLLYVGITANPSRRFEKHRHEKNWWPAVSRIELEHFDHRRDALDAERTAIETEKPTHNIKLNGRERARVVWKCSDCGLPIDDGDGYLCLDWRELVSYKRALDQWNELVDSHQSVGGFRVISGTDLLAHPKPACWQILHRECDPEPEAESYWIAVERIRTVDTMLSWTLHLSEKNWFDDTNWRELIRKQTTWVTP